LPQQSKTLENSGMRKYSKTLADYFAGKPLYLDEPIQKKPNIRKLVEQPWQQTKAQFWDEVTDTLCKLEFIQAKACDKMTYDLLKEINTILVLMPNYKTKKHNEKDRYPKFNKVVKSFLL
jgi:hypothetical protein